MLPNVSNYVGGVSIALYLFIHRAYPSFPSVVKHLVIWKSTALVVIFTGFTISCAFFWLPMRGAMTYCISIISSYSRAMVSSIGPSSSSIVDCHSTVLKFCDDDHCFSVARCSTCYFIASNSLLNLEFSLSKYSKLSYVDVANATFFAITSLRFLLVLEVITLSVTTETGFWGSYG